MIGLITLNFMPPTSYRSMANPTLGAEAIEEFLS